MFTIDLLKGRGIPPRSRPENIAAAVTAFAAPVIVAIIMFGCYISDSINISIQKQKIANYNAKIDELSDAANLQKAYEKEKLAVNGCRSDIAVALDRYTQWSPVLMAVVESLPDSVMLTKLEVKQQIVRRKVPQKNDSKKMLDVSVPTRTLQINVSGSPQNDCDRAVKDFRDRLRASQAMGSRLDDIVVSQKFDTLQGQNAVSYEIDCVFKPGL
jgi:Tfp pilus assembly protein PilN